jgi:hypothetical protein
MKHLFTFSSILFLLMQSSCMSLHTGSMQQSSFLAKNNFKVVATIEGSSKATYVFGIGGNNKDGLVKEAKRNMYSYYTLEANQILTNITTDVKTRFFILPFLFMDRQVFVSADVVQFYDSTLLSKTGTMNGGTWMNGHSQKSKEEQIIDSVKMKQNQIQIKYTSIQNVQIGDVVLYSSSNNQEVYGIVFEIGLNNRIKIKTYTNTGKELIIEDKYTWFTKIK